VSPRDPKAKPLVLYVEDDADTFKLAQLRLEAKYELINAPTDRRAFGLLLEHHVDLFAVLMDIELKESVLDGLGLVKAIRGLTAKNALPSWAQGLPALPHLPIIVMTEYATRYSEDQVKAVGANYFLTKPIDFMRLNLALAQVNIQSVMARLAAPTRTRTR
jgi:CheY-like chemotaxis protein